MSCCSPLKHLARSRSCCGRGAIVALQCAQWRDSAGGHVEEGRRQQGGGGRGDVFAVNVRTARKLSSNVSEVRSWSRSACTDHQSRLGATIFGRSFVPVPPTLNSSSPPLPTAHLSFWNGVDEGDSPAGHPALIPLQLLAQTFTSSFGPFESKASQFDCALSILPTRYRKIVLVKDKSPLHLHTEPPPPHPRTLSTTPSACLHCLSSTIHPTTLNPLRPFLPLRI